jgi:Zn-dependent protease
MDLNEVIIYAFIAVTALISLTFHEVAHGYSAHLLGDDTAKNAGRLTLNPIKHVDIMGLICLILLRFGWAKPVPINPYNFQNRKQVRCSSALPAR